MNINNTNHNKTKISCFHFQVLYKYYLLEKKYTLVDSVSPTFVELKISSTFIRAVRTIQLDIRISSNFFMNLVRIDLQFFPKFLISRI